MRRQYSDEDVESSSVGEVDHVQLTAEHLQKVAGQAAEDDVVGFYDKKDRFDDAEYADLQYAMNNTRKVQSRCWCFTWNNYPIDHKARLMILPYSYIVWGYEIGGKTGTPHLQGFVVFDSDQRFGKRLKNGNYHKSSLKGRFPEVYWKVMYSNAESCIKYCKKDGNYQEFGTLPPGQGARTDISAVCERIAEGVPISQVACEFPVQFVKFSRGFENFYHSLRQHRTGRSACILWLWGSTGTGKSEYAERLHGRDNVYRKSDGTRFWIDYDYQQAVVIEEFKVQTKHVPDGWNVEYLLQLLDRYQFTVEIKGGQVKFNSQFIYITSDLHPDRYFSDERFPQICRRLDMIYELTPDSYRRDSTYSGMFYDPSKDVPKTFILPESSKALANNKNLLGLRPLMLTAQKTLNKAIVEHPQGARDDSSTIYSDERHQ